MNKKVPFLIVGYILGAFSLVASLSALVYTKASVGVSVAGTDANCRDL